MQEIIVLPNGCWEWQGNLTASGYGVLTARKKASVEGRKSTAYLAHRYFYEETGNTIFEGLVLDHICHTNDKECLGGDTCPHRRCVNPAHLEPVTQGENALRGLGPCAVNLRKTHCKRGHEYVVGTYSVNVRGGRDCLECRALDSREYLDSRSPEFKLRRRIRDQAKRTERRKNPAYLEAQRAYGRANYYKVKAQKALETVANDA